MANNNKQSRTPQNSNKHRKIVTNAANGGKLLATTAYENLRTPGTGENNAQIPRIKQNISKEI